MKVCDGYWDDGILCSIGEFTKERCMSNAWKMKKEESYSLFHIDVEYESSFEQINSY